MLTGQTDAEHIDLEVGINKFVNQLDEISREHFGLSPHQSRAFLTVIETGGRKAPFVHEQRKIIIVVCFDGIGTYRYNAVVLI